MLSIVFKVISILIIDIVTIKIVFSIWVLLNIGLFPLAICFIFLSLIIFNFVIAFSSTIIEKFGMSLFITLASSSAIYYFFTMIFTGINYIVITPKMYFVLMMVVTLLFLLINAGFLVVKNKNNNEKEYMNNIKLLMMSTIDSLQKNKDFLNENDYVNLKSSIEKTFERLNSSTPFGRISDVNVINKEHEIIRKIKEVNLLFSNKLDKNTTKDANEIVETIYYLVCYREKLIIK